MSTTKLTLLVEHNVCPQCPFYSYMSLVVCNLADNMGVDKFVTPHDILAGNKNLNLAFVADMFSKYPGIR